MPVLKIKQNGEWLNIAGGGAAEIEDVITLDLDDAISGEANGINADTLGGKTADEFATEAFVVSKIEEAMSDISDNIDFSGYATKDDLNGFITEIPSEYVIESELTDYAKKSEIPDVSAFQTAEQVSSLINEALGVIENGSY